MLENLEQIIRRLTSNAWYEVLVEVVLIWVFVYLVLRFLRGTRGAGVIKGVAFLLIGATLMIRVLGGWTDAFSRLNFIYDKFLGLLAILLIVVFQPELRRAMVRLGETRLFRPSRRTMQPTIEAVASAAQFLSKNQFGALIAIERSVNLDGLADSGVRLDAQVSARLLQSIFWPNNPLHDLGVIVKGETVLAASVQFPLVEEHDIPAELGSRHRAGMGLSAETDALVVIVSEETGQISLADRGRLVRDVPRDEVGLVLFERLRAPGPQPEEREEEDETDSDEQSTGEGPLGTVATGTKESSTEAA